MNTVQSLATQMSAAFVTSTRTDGTTFVKLADNSPQWMVDVCQAAHGDMMPDDTRYRFIQEAVDALSENDDTEQARDSATEPDIYTYQLTGWLYSRVDRIGWVDSVLEDMQSKPTSISDLLMLAQSTEKDEVFGLVLGALEDLVSDAEDDAADDAAGSPNGD